MLPHSIRKDLGNIPGWSTKRKLVVFESDDWGSIRMPSKDAFAKLKKRGIDLESNSYRRYNLYDTLARRSDLENLYEVLSSIKDQSGSTCIFTPLCIVANPDFNKIEETNFQSYFYEPFTDTLSRYYPGENVFELWKEGISKRLFVPQFHGREHLNVKAWLGALQRGDEKSIASFKEGLWGIVPDKAKGFTIENQAAFQLTHISDIETHREIITEGLSLFQSLFGYKAEYFVPPNGPINNVLNKTLVDNGIKYRSTAKIQLNSTDRDKFKKTLNWLGKRDKYGIRYITRNCFFEPSQDGKDWVNSCLYDISSAFHWRKPAIISTHRVNYIGVHDSNNRDRSLHQLKYLLKELINRWPDIEFITSNELGNIMADNNAKK